MRFAVAILVAAGLLLLAASAGARRSASVVAPVSPGSLAVGLDGTLFVADDARNQILRRLPDGAFAVVAGNGKRGFSGDGGKAVDASLSGPGGMAVAADGTLYFADSGNNRVRAVSAHGTITTVAGNGRAGWTASGSAARSAPLLSPEDVAIGPGGRLYIADSGYSKVLRLERGGTLTRIAGVPRYEGVYGIRRAATRASADDANGLAFDAAGNLYLAGLSTKTLLMIDHAGVMRLPAGMTGFYPRGAGGLVTDAHGRVLAMDTQDIVAVSPAGIRTIDALGSRKIAGIKNFLPNGIAVSRDGTIYIDTDRGNGWSSRSAIVALVAGGRARTLWTG
jgi:hypothetical protein